MSPPEQTQSRGSLRKFLRIAGTLWLVAVLALLIGAFLAPHMGRMVNFVLHQTAHRHWTRLTLHPERPYVDLSTPAHTVTSYYSALYRGDAAAMEHLTLGAFRQQMRQRLTHTEATASTLTYRSYLRTESLTDQNAIVLEKFHLFWQRGLRFRLQRQAADWRIVGVEVMP
ncbi:hypothetical protein NKDENANG_03838 [Candidatus Entotheonellaceae bacterium PAL068K]